MAKYEDVNKVLIEQVLEYAKKHKLPRDMEKLWEYLHMLPAEGDDFDAMFARYEAVAKARLPSSSIASRSVFKQHVLVNLSRYKGMSLLPPPSEKVASKVTVYVIP